jgi:lysophospholipase L1-like esterase
MPAMRPFRAYLSLAVVLVLLDVEGARYCRLNCDFWKDTYPATGHRVRSEAYHHGLAPNRQITKAWGLARYRYATNSLGFKDAAPRTVGLKGTGRQILFLGDSFTEGKGFPYAQTFVGLVAEKLSANSVEVLNGGVDSYAPVTYRLKTKHLLEKVGLGFDAVVVFLDVSDIYDQAERYRFDGEGRLIVPLADDGEGGGVAWDVARAFRFLRDNSMTARFLSVVYDHLELTARAVRRRNKISEAMEKPFSDVTPLDLWADAVTGLKVAAWTYDDARWRAFGEAGRKRAAADMDGLLSLLKKHGIGLTLAVYPWPDQLFRDPLAPRHVDFWRDWSRARGVPFINLFPVFTKGKPRDVLERYFIPYDFHWNAEGHRLVAETFLGQYSPPW